MAVTDEQRAILQVLRLLLIKGQDWARRVKTEDSRVASYARFELDALNEMDLDTHLLYRGPTGRFGDREVIYVEPPSSEKDAFAALWCRWDFDSERPKCGFHFGVWCTRADLGGNPAFLGYRYETPEVGDNHNYYHAQPCRSMITHQSLAEALPVPERYPTFPIAADSSVELLLCLVTSIHGMSGLRELESSVNENQALRGNRCLTRPLDHVMSLQRSCEA